MKMFYCFIVLLVSFFCFADNKNSLKKLIYCSEGSPSFFNPQLASDGPSINISHDLYDRLIEFDRKRPGRVRPGLAKSWSISKDKRTYTFKLRKNVAFHKRSYFTPTRPFNADDVVFSFQRQKNKKHPWHLINGGSYPYFNSLGMGHLIKKIIKVDLHTVQFVLNKKDATFLINLAMEFSSILSKEYADYLLKKNKPENLDFYPVGTGPFMFKTYIKDSVTRLIRHPHYFRKPARLSAVIATIVPDSPVRFQKLKAGECHLIAQPSPLDLLAMKKHPDIKLVGGNRHTIAYLAMNVEKPPFNKLKVRQAIHHALNRPLYIKAIYDGHAEMARTVYPSNLWSHNPTVQDYEYSPEKARGLLKEAGYEKGFKTTLWTLPIARPYNPNGKKMGELMQADLAKVGISTKLFTYDWPSYISRAGKGEHEMIQFGWIGDNGDPDNFLRTLLSCDSIKSGVNLARWCFAPFDKLIKKALLFSHQKTRAGFYKKAQTIFKKQAPWVTLVHTHNYAAMRKSVKGYIHVPFGTIGFYPLSLE